MTIARGTAYGEPFSEATASLQFEGDGVRLDGIDMHKGGGTVTGAAYVGWNGTYSFNVDGRGIAVDTLTLTAFPAIRRSTGSLDFTATGSGTFEEPRYDVKCGVRDLFFGDEGIGEMTGRLSVRGTADDLRAGSGVAAPGGVGHRPHRAQRRDGCGAVVPRDRHLARSVPARRSSRRSRRSRRRSPAARFASSASSTTPTRCASTPTSKKSNLRLLDYRLRNQSPIRVERRAPGAAGRCAEAGGRGYRARSQRAPSTCAIRRWRCRPTARRTSPCCRASCRTFAARAAPRSPRESAARPRRRSSSGNALLTDGRLRQLLVPARARGPERHRHVQRARRAARRHHGPARRRRRFASAAASACPAIN